jgi:hypothetical protein
MSVLRIAGIVFIVIIALNIVGFIVAAIFGVAASSGIRKMSQEFENDFHNHDIHSRFNRV